jgi:hypothetical protein
LQRRIGLDAGWLIVCAMELGDGSKRAEAPASRWISKVMAQHCIKVRCPGGTGILIRLLMLSWHFLPLSPGGFCLLPTLPYGTARIEEST